MLFTYGKIKTINQDHPVLNPTLDQPMDFYTGQYYIPEGIKLKGTDYELDLEPGFLEVYTNYSEIYGMKPGTAFYINYKLTTKKGLIYTWRYYVNTLEETVVRLNKSDQPNLLLTSKSLGKLSYTREEMEERFMLRRDSKLFEPNYTIGFPIIEKRKLETIPPFLDMKSMSNFYQDDNVEKITLMKDLPIEAFFNLEKNIKVVIDSNLHPYETFQQWNDVFQAKPNWDKEYMNNKRVSESNGYIFPSQLKTFGSWGLMSFLHMKLGEYFIDILGYNFEVSDNKVSVLKIANNTYLPYYNTTELEGKNDIYNMHIKYAHRFKASPLYMSRLFVTPDEDIQTYPLVHYAKSLYSEISSNNEHTNVDYLKHRNLTQTDIEQIRYEKINSTMFNTGILSTSVIKKHDPIVLFNRLKRDNKSELMKYSNFMKYGNRSWLLHIFSDALPDSMDGRDNDIYTHLFDLDPAKAIYRSLSTNALQLDHNRKFIDLVRNKDVVEDIRLGPEIRTIIDKSNINLDDYNNRLMEININNNRPNLVLTYFKPEIVKNSPRYKTNPGNVYDPAYPEQIDFLNRLENRKSLKINEKLAIDKITVGFRPLQVKMNGVWKDLQ